LEEEEQNNVICMTLVQEIKSPLHSS